MRQFIEFLKNKETFIKSLKRKRLNFIAIDAVTEVYARSCKKTEENDEN